VDSLVTKLTHQIPFPAHPPSLPPAFLFSLSLPLTEGRDTRNVKILLSAGADPYAPGPSGRSVVEQAKAEEDKERDEEENEEEEEEGEEEEEKGEEEGDKEKDFEGIKEGVVEVLTECERVRMLIKARVLEDEVWALVRGEEKEEQGQEEKNAEDVKEFSRFRRTVGMKKEGRETVRMEQVPLFLRTRIENFSKSTSRKRKRGRGRKDWSKDLYRRLPRVVIGGDIESNTKRHGEEEMARRTNSTEEKEEKVKLCDEGAVKTKDEDGEEGQEDGGAESEKVVAALCAAVQGNTMTEMVFKELVSYMRCTWDPVLSEEAWARGWL
jgi:hypothetical protein